MIKIPQKPENLKTTFKNDKRKIKFKEHKITDNKIPIWYWDIIEEYLNDRELLFLRNVSTKHLKNERFMYYIPFLNLLINYNNRRIKYTEDPKVIFTKENNINLLNISSKNILNFNSLIERYDEKT